MKFLRKISTLLYVWYIDKYPGKMRSRLETVKRNSYPVSRVRRKTINILRTNRQMILPQSFRGDLSSGQTRHRVEVLFSVRCHAIGGRYERVTRCLVIK